MKETDKHFRELMKAYKVEKAPVNFTINVMDRIYAQSRMVSEYKPVLNEWLLRSVYAVFGMFLLYAMFSRGPSELEKKPSVFDKFIDHLPQVDLPSAAGAGEQITGLLGQLPQFVVAIFLSATILLLLDQLFLKRRRYR
jgi:hypothetical protein